MPKLKPLTSRVAAVIDDGSTGRVAQCGSVADYDLAAIDGGYTRVIVGHAHRQHACAAFGQSGAAADLIGSIIAAKRVILGGIDGH